MMSTSTGSPISAPDSQSTVHDTSRQLTLRGMLVATAVFGAILGGALRLEAPALFVNCVLAGAAALAWKIGRPSGMGTAFGALGAQAAVLSGFAYYYDDSAVQEFIVTLLVWIAAILLTIAFFIFCRHGQTECGGARRNQIAAAICVITPIGGMLIAAPILRTFREAWIAERNIQIAAQNAENTRRLGEFIAEVTAVCKRIGDAPADEAELVRQLGHQMPEIARSGRSSAVNYHRAGPNRFLLDYFDGDIHAFDSGNAAAGWVKFPF